MKIRNQFFQLVFKISLIGALLNIAIILLLFYIKNQSLSTKLFLDIRWVLYSLFIFFSLKLYKEKKDGVLHFFESMIVGLLVYLNIAFITALFIIGFSSIEPQFLLIYIDSIVEHIRNNEDALLKKNISKEELKTAIQLISNTTRYNLAVDYFLKSIPIGLILTILFSIIMRRYKSEQK